MVRIYTFIICGCIVYKNVLSQLVFNEYMNRNYNAVLDTYENDPDWIEIYNTSNTSIELDEFYLSDDENEPQKWKFPDIDLNTGELVVVFASGNDIVIGNEIHANFKIGENETIYLFSENGDIVDELPYVNHKGNMSYGRFPNGSENWHLFRYVTAGQLNNETDIEHNIHFSKEAGLYVPGSNLELAIDYSNV